VASVILISSSLRVASKHIMASIVLIVGYATGGTVFMQVSFLELCPAYLCSESPEFSNPFKCAPHPKDKLEGFCGRSDLYHQVDWKDPTSLRNWYTQLDLTCKFYNLDGF
jgi:hypothetical protein